MDNEIILFIIKLIAGGLVTFMAIAVMSKIRDIAWIFMVAGFLLSYTSLVFNLLTQLGVFSFFQLYFPGSQLPLLSIISIILPSLSFIIGFILLILKK